MIIKQRIEDATKNVQSEGRGLCRVLAVGVLLAVATVALCVAGCSTLTQDEIARLDKIFWEWVERQEAKGETPPSAEPMPETPPTQTPPATDSSDAVAFDKLRWLYGGFNGSKAARDEGVALSSLSIKNGNRLFYRWEKGLSAWGLAHTDPGAICAVFFERDGTWIGGKFDWVSTSRSDRELKHVESYNNWPQSGIKLPWNGRVAFVVVDKGGRKRSNVLVAGGGK